MSGYVGSKRSSSLVSATDITLDGAKLKSSGDSITKSDGTTSVLSESGGTVTLTADAAVIEGSSSGDLVRITQTGTGNALVVEDSTNPDSTPFVVDASGNVLVGTTSTGVAAGGSGTSGININASGAIEVARSDNTVLFVNRTTSDGEIIQLCRNGARRGSIRVFAADNLQIYSTTGGHTGLEFGSLGVAPLDNTGFTADDVFDLGYSFARWDDVYATNGTIKTSDRNEKQDIEELTEAEQRVAVRAKALMRKFRWKSAVAKKGDEARIHFGIIAQDLQAAFEAEGLNAGRYGMFISNTWWETSETYTDDEGIEQTRINTYDTAEEAPEGQLNVHD